MIVLIFVFAALIIFLLAIAFSVSQGIVETNTSFPVGNLEQAVLLDCTFQTSAGKGTPGSALITWVKEGLPGVVYQYQNNNPQLKDQNSQFHNRARLFPDVISTGNASLLLSTVTMKDAGVYSCAVSAPGVSGTVSMNLRVGAFSAPMILMSNGSLSAVAPRWQPQPNVTWHNQNGTQLISSTEFHPSADGTVQLLSSLQNSVMKGETYTCVIQNLLVRAISDTTVIADKNISTNTYFLFNSSPVTLPLQALCAAPVLLYLLVW
ncbi:V-set domain-containing T-cell activation inhibitor 1 isoform X2 [Brachyhypopomus gauderio]